LVSRQTHNDPSDQRRHPRKRDDPNGKNSAQVFGLNGTARNVQLTVTDNYRNFQGITAGGDRAGLGEVRFYGEVIPEPAGLSLLLLAGGFAMRRRR
jgi:hypothetical protein